LDTMLGARSSERMQPATSGDVAPKSE